MQFMQKARIVLLTSSGEFKGGEVEVTPYWPKIFFSISCLFPYKGHTGV